MLAATGLDQVISLNITIRIEKDNKFSYEHRKIKTCQYIYT